MMTRAHAMHAPHHEGRARPSLFVLINILSRWRPSIPFFRKPIAWRRAHAMAQELQDPTTSHQETSLVWAQTAPNNSNNTSQSAGPGARRQVPSTLLDSQRAAQHTHGAICPGAGAPSPRCQPLGQQDSLHGHRAKRPGTKRRNLQRRWVSL